MSASNQLAAQADPGLKEAVRQHADREGMSESLVIRQAVMRWLGVDRTGKPVARHAADSNGTPRTMEQQAFDAVTAQDRHRLSNILAEMAAGDVRELQWVAGELAKACDLAVRGRPLPDPEADAAEVKTRRRR